MIIQCTKKLLDKGLIKMRIVDGNDPEVCEYLEPDKYTVLIDTKTKLKDIFEETEECFFGRSLRGANREFTESMC